MLPGNSIQRKKKEITLEQEAVDHAFSQEQRSSGRRYQYQQQTIVVLNGMATGMEGVLQASDDQLYPLTNLERTLLDITVRPSYSGGALAVLEMYRKALKMEFSMEELLGILNHITFIYPYHQSIGFYLQRAGYAGGDLSELKKKEQKIDFYLDYNMPEKKYSSEWKLYYPAQMDVSG